MFVEMQTMTLEERLMFILHCMNDTFVDEWSRVHMTILDVVYSVYRLQKQFTQGVCIMCMHNSWGQYQ